MKKKLFSVLLSVVMASTLLVGCGGSNQTAEKKEETKTEQSDAKNDEQSADGAEIALITDVGTIDDKSFNQGAWEGVEQFAKEAGKTHKYYKPTEKSDAACITAIELAIKGGAKVVVCPGFLFEVPIYKMQTKYPDTKFIILDGAPHDLNKDAEITENTASIFYAEEQSGYLAGYAAVKEGYRQLGFMGGIAVPAVIRFGYGYIQGADAAAKELNLAKDDVKIKYTYVGNFDATPENETKASSWFTDGTEVIFACGGAVGNSVMKAAEKSKKAVIGVDVDQSGESETVITSAMKNLKNSVYETLKTIYDDKFEGGKSVVLGADTGNVLLAMDTARFKNFTKEEYDKIYQDIVDGKVVVNKDDIAENAAEVPTELVKVENIQ